MRCNKCRTPIEHEGWCAACDLEVHPPAPFQKRVIAEVDVQRYVAKDGGGFVVEVPKKKAPARKRKAAAKK